MEYYPVMSGVIKLHILGGSNNCEYIVVLRDFPYNRALFGLVI